MVKKIISTLCIMALILSGIPAMQFINKINKVEAASLMHSAGYYTWTDSGGYPHTTALIYNGTTLVYCIDENAYAPSSGGTLYSDGTVYTDPSQLAILYYGYGGAGYTGKGGITDYVKTWVALNNWRNGKTSTRYPANSDSFIKSLYDHANKKDAPSINISFNKSYVTSNISGNIQKSDTITLNGSSSEKAILNLPSQVTIYISNGKSQTGGSATIYGGQSFYFTAPLTYNTDYVTGIVNAWEDHLATILYIPNNGSYQPLLERPFYQTDPVTKSGFTAHFFARNANINVKYQNQNPNYDLFQQTNDTKVIGSSFTYTAPPYFELAKYNNYYDLVSNNTWSGTVPNGGTSHIFYYKLRRTVTVNYIDNRTGDLITQKSYIVHEGDSYSESPRTDLMYGNYPYRYIKETGSPESGTVGWDDININYYYDAPLIKVGLKKLQIYTAPADKGLPVKIDLSKTNIYPNNTPGMTTANLSVNLYQGTQELVSNQYTAQSLPTSISMTIPSSSGLTKDTNKLYTVKIEGFNSNDVALDSTASSLATHGYTSTQVTYNVNVSQTTALSKSAVIMTEITPTTTEKHYNETFNYTFMKAPDMKTGYGYENNVSLSYKNDLANALPATNMIYNVPQNFIDTDNYMPFSISNGQASIPMTEADSTTTSGTQATTTVSYKLPHVNVEVGNGDLFSDQEVAAKDSRITVNDFRDGGNKMYLPIWKLDLGTYPVSSTSNGVGVNLINVKETDTVAVKAFMIAWMGSPTIEDDELLMVPVDPNHPNMSVLKGWTQSDLDWLKQ